MKGFTLLEFLISTCIFGLLIGLAVPGFGFYIEKNRSDVASTEIFRAYQFARYYAVKNFQKVYFCGTTNGSKCDKYWSNKIVVFVDKDDNKHASPNEIIRHFQLDLGNAQIRSRFAFGKPYTVLRPDGQASFTGSMIYCPHNGEAKNVKRVTWNRVGRPYKGIDRNGDGLIEDTNGKALITACPK